MPERLSKIQTKRGCNLKNVPPGIIAQGQIGIEASLFLLIFLIIECSSSETQLDLS